MPRPRHAVVPQFDTGATFDEQLYEALRKSPWWVASIAFHVVLALATTLWASDPEAAPRAVEVAIRSEPPTDTMPEPEAPPPLDETDTPRVDPNELVPKEEPDFRDVPEDEKDRTDVDSEFDETAGNDGKADAPLAGVAAVSHIGIGGGAGDLFGRPGRGSNRSTKRPGGPLGRRGEDALEDALKWLAAHQSPDGGWEAEGFRRWCDRKQVAEGPDGAGKAQYDVGVTGLSLLAFLGAGYTNRSEGPFGKVVADGLRYLKVAQDAEGCFGSRSHSHYVYNHAIAALAMVEAYGMTGSSNFKIPAQKSLDFLGLARNPYFAWRYGVKPGDNDTSVTGWMMMALKSAKLINQADVKAGRPPSLQIDEEAFDGIRSWVEKMTDPDTGRVGYQQRGTGPARPLELIDRFPADKSESMTAAGVLARIFVGEDPRSSDAVKKGAALCAAMPPRWAPDGSIDMYYWYYATLALFQVGGEPWSKWEAAMRPAIVETQRKDGDYCMFKGSWDPLDPWGGDGGRVYATACLAMCLEVWYRYPRVIGTLR